MTVGNEGNLTGDNGWTKVSTDGNLVTEMSRTIHVTHDSNDIVVRVRMTDRAATEVRKVYRLAEVARENLPYVYTGNC